MKKPKPNSKKRKKQANHFSFQYVYKYKNWLLLTILLVIPFLFVLPSNSVVRTDTCGTVGTLQNGGFESGEASWETTATDGDFEITDWSGRSTTRVRGDFLIVGPGDSYTREGTTLAELQANQGGGQNQGLYQDITTTPGSRIFISFWHHFRSGENNNTQTVAARVGAVPQNVPAASIWTTAEQNDSTTFGTRVASNNANSGEDWEQASAVYDVPTGQTSSRFLFLSEASPAFGFGNLLDDITFTPFLACPVTRTVTFGTPDVLNVVSTSGVTYGINQSLTNSTSASNPNGSAGSVSRNGNEITFTPVSAGNSQTVDYTASMTFSGTTYTDEARITYNVSATVPGSPTSLSATPSGTQVVLSWTAPSNNGGVAISDYVVEFQEGSGSWQTFSDGVSSSTSATITGLTGSSNYNFRVSAKNDGSGYSGPGTTGTGSTSSTLAVNAWLPGAPTLNTPSSPSSTSVDLTWSAPASVGLSAITSYFLEYRLFSDTAWTSINTGNTNTSRTVSSLTANQTYVFRISATNSQGTGTASSTQTITLGANCSAGSSSTISNSTTVIVTFSAPSNTANGICDWIVPNNVFSLDYLLVAGGGGGGSGGGGGGGVVSSFQTTNVNNTTNSASTPLSVTPGETISVTIGRGGTGGAGGSARASNTGPDGRSTGLRATSGSNSIFGSVEALGGGAGGSASLAGTAGGSSGGSAYDANTNQVTNASTSTVVGASSYGNAGGASLAGSFSAGGGGGGGGATGGNSRFLSSGCGAEGCTSFQHGGGDGARGIRSAINSLSGTLTEFGCGGGGGVNSNSNAQIIGGGGAAGCASAGAGSRYGNLNTNYTTDTTDATINGYMATSGTNGFGGGGGGTDPEDTRGANGGSGVVVIRYSLVDTNCPNDDNASVTTPVACPTSVSIQADGASTSVQVRTSPISFSTSANSPTLSVLTRPVANPTSGNLSATVSGANINISVPSGSSLIGGTYPVTYRLTEGSNTSDSYILVTVEDPTQITPIVIPIDPRAREVNLSKFILGASTNVLVCVLDSDDDSYSSVPQFSIPTPIPSVTPSTRSTPNGLSLRGARTQVEPQTSNIVVSRASGDTRLVPGLNSRFLNVNVSNTANGGNNSCEGGTESTIEIKPIDISLIDVVNLILGR
jgi:hypothetical protein